MGENMKEIIYSIKRKINKNKRILNFTIGLALIGVISGSIFLTIISKNDQIMIKDYISSFINSIKDNHLDYISSFKNTLISNFSFSLIIFLFGISIIGIPIIYFMYFFKSFMIGFSLSSFVFTYKIKGILPSVFYIIPHLINFIFYTILVIYATKISILLYKIIFDKNNIKMKNVIKKYLIYYIILLIFILISALMESFLVPFILSKMI